MNGRTRVLGRTICTAALALCLLSQPIHAGPIRTFRGTEEPRDDTQLGSGHQNSVAYRGEWEIPVQGNSVVATGAGEVPFQFVFSHPYTGESYESSLLTNAFPISDQTEAFYQDWGASVAYMTEYLNVIFEEQVNFVSYDNIVQPTGSNIYVFYFELWDDNWENIYPVTVAYRFDQSYYMFAMGINLVDLPEIFQITKRAAGDFKDYTSEPKTGIQTSSFSGTYRHTLAEWKYDVINPFQILMELMYE